MTATVVPLVQEQTKTCTKCGENKVIGDFPFRSPSGSGKRNAQCRLCVNIRYNLYLKKRKARDPEFQEKRRKQHRNINDKRKFEPEIILRKRFDFLRRTYGLSRKELEVMLELQAYSCANKRCCRPLRFDHSERNSRPCVDHNHETGEVRSLLCISCNGSLGLARDDQEILLGLIEYIGEHS